MRARESLWQLSPLAVLALLFAAWWSGTLKYALGIPDIALPSPMSVFVKLFQSPGIFVKHLEITTFEGLAAFGFGSLLGIAFGIAIYNSGFLRESVYPLLIGFNSVPKSAMVPILIIWWGAGMIPAILLGTLISFFPLMINTLLGLGTISPNLVDLAHSLKAGKLNIFLKIRLPNALPYIFAGLRIAAPLSLAGVTVSEIVASDAGLGYLLKISQTHLEMAQFYGGIIMLAILGLSFFALALILERLLIPWYRR